MSSSQPADEEKFELYHPNDEDFDQFYDFYCAPGAIYPIPAFGGLTFEQFSDAAIRYQEERKKWCEKNGQEFSTWFEFESLERELVRDQILHDKGLPVVGYIYCTSKAQKMFGLEQMNLLEQINPLVRMKPLRKKKKTTKR